MHSWQSNGYKANKSPKREIVQRQGTSQTTSHSHPTSPMILTPTPTTRTDNNNNSSRRFVYPPFLTTKRYLLVISYYELQNIPHKLCKFRVCSFVFYQVAIRMLAHWDRNDRNNEQLSVLSSSDFNNNAILVLVTQRVERVSIRTWNTKVMPCWRNLVRNFRPLHSFIFIRLAVLN